MKRLLRGAALFTAGLTVGLALALLLAARDRKRDSDNNSKPAVLITMSATIDGSERFVFTPDNVWNIHGQWSPPQKVYFNGEPWPDLTQPPPGWADFAKSLDLAGASIAVRKGRDVIALEPTADGFELIFADTQMGAASYEVTLSIPRK
jgi:hypothetical protein